VIQLTFRDGSMELRDPLCPVLPYMPPWTPTGVCELHTGLFDGLIVVATGARDWAHHLRDWRGSEGLFVWRILDEDTLAGEWQSCSVDGSYRSRA
jgi:hypothetical protein